MKTTPILLALLLTPVLLSAQSTDPRTDSVDVSKYSLTMDMRQMAQKQLSGVCRIDFSINQFQLDTLRLDLLNMTVDSVKNPKTQAAHPFLYDGKTLWVKLDNSFVANSQGNAVEVYYHGSPGMDASGWGGFYFTPPYAFNLGVGFAANPHCYGRAWFPCMDNFTDRAEFDCEYTVPKNYAATCATCTDSYQLNADSSRTYSGKSSGQSYCTYLPSISAAPYQFVKWNHSGKAQQLPVLIAAQAADTANVRSSFRNLDSCISGFESSYGPYRFGKVGYSVVPFGSGAMEHVGNIAYPRYAADGGLAYEHLYAHELSHMWWGNNTTCRTPEDMWLNEGWASYSEALFMEKVYGTAAYKTYVADNHRDVLHYTHLKDSGYRAVSGVPHRFTYGSTVYEKGADMVHTLRGYMGDSAFFAACLGFQEHFKYSDVSSEDMWRYFQNFTPKNLRKFFEFWIFKAGFPCFEARMQTAGPACTWTLNQKIYETKTNIDSVWIPVTFIGKNFEKRDTMVYSPYPSNTFQSNLPFIPEMLIVDRHEKLSDAVSQDIVVVKPNQTYSLKHGMIDVKIPDGQAFDSALLSVQHVWVSPFINFNGKKVPSTRRYWHIQCNKPIDVPFEFTLNYNGQKNMNGGYLDHDILPKSEDSIRLFCSDGKGAWGTYPAAYAKGNNNDRKGQITFEYNRSHPIYTLGYFDSKVVVGMIEQIHQEIKLFPNPAKGQIKFQVSEPYTETVVLNVLDMAGRQVLTQELLSGQAEAILHVADAGSYMLVVNGQNGRQLGSQKFVMLR